MSTKETVYVVEDDPGVIKSLSWMLESNGLSAAMYATATNFLEEAAVDCPSCLILDISLPDMSGIEVLREIGKRPKLAMPVIVLTGTGNIAAAVECMKLGAVDFLEKPAEHGVLLVKVRESLAGDARRRDRDAQQNILKRRIAQLTEREREVLQLLCQGKSTKEMASVLHISMKTISIHRWHLMKKMQASSATEAVRLAFHADVA